MEISSKVSADMECGASAGSGRFSRAGISRHLSQGRKHAVSQVFMRENGVARKAGISGADQVSRPQAVVIESKKWLGDKESWRKNGEQTSFKPVCCAALC